MTRHKNLQDWLQWLKHLHPKAIDLGLQRPWQVARRLQLLKPPTAVSHHYSAPLASSATVITVAGTNGKGSCVSSLEQLLLADNRSVATYTSPCLHHFCEQIRIDGQMVSEATIIEAFTAVDRARQSVSLTCFEFTTLAALWIFVEQKIPFIVLEVGLGGRLDGVNIIDADIAIITSIALDHQAWLGEDRDTISREKLGIARRGRPLIIAEPELTPGLIEAATLYPTLRVNRDFHFAKTSDRHWRFDLNHEGHQQQFTLPLPGLPLASVAAALCAVQRLHLTMPADRIALTVARLSLPGRFEQREVAGVPVIYDVAHNPAAAANLARNLANKPVNGRTLAVFAVLADKDRDTIIAAIAGTVDHWFVGELQGVERGADRQALIHGLEKQGRPYSAYPSIEEAFTAALGDIASRPDSHDRIVVFGSFHTVAKVQVLVKHTTFPSLPSP